MSSSPRRRSLRTVALLGSLAALGVAGAAPSVAGAASDNWSCWLGSGSYCNTDRHSIRSVSNYSPNGRTVGSAASTTGGTGGLYGSFVYGGGYSCHSYSGANVLYPLISNNSGGGPAAFYGASTYGTGADSC
jgi:hypothetical protein